MAVLTGGLRADNAGVESTGLSLPQASRPSPLAQHSVIELLRRGAGPRLSVLILRPTLTSPIHTTLEWLDDRTNMVSCEGMGQWLKETKLAIENRAQINFDETLTLFSASVRPDVYGFGIPILGVDDAEQTSSPASTGDEVTGSSRQLGRLKGQIWIAPDFDETPDDLTELFENGGIFPE